MDAESPTEPGKLSVLSEPLTQFCADFDAFYDGVIRSMKDPVLNPMEHHVIKSIEVSTIGPEEWVVKIIHDGAKLKKFGLQETEEDRVGSWAHIWSSRKQREIVQEYYSPDGAKVTATTHVKFLQDPFRVEAWLDEASGVRRSGPVLRGCIRDTFLNPIVRELATRKVKVEHSVESPSTEGVCAISEPLEPHLPETGAGHSEVFDAMIELMKSTGSSMMAQLGEAAGGLCREVLDLSEHEFQLSLSAKIPVATHKGSQTYQTVGIRSNFVHDREKGDISGVASTMQGELLWEYRFKLHKEPMRLEYYAFISSRRTGGRVEAATVQVMADAIVDLLGVGKDGDWYW